MIERYPQGIRLHDGYGGGIDGAFMAACAQLPVIVWNGARGAYYTSGPCLANPCDLSPDPAAARRFTLAEAYFATKDKDADQSISFQPIDYLRLDLPLPTSVNGLFVEAAGRKKGAGRQRVKTREYKAWIDAAGWALKPQLQEQGAPILPDVPTFGRHWALWIRLNVDHQGDVTNRVKALEDLLVAWNITVGDQWNDRCLVERDRSLDVDCRVIIYRKVPRGD